MDHAPEATTICTATSARTPLTIHRLVVPIDREFAAESVPVIIWPPRGASSTDTVAVPAACMNASTTRFGPCRGNDADVYVPGPTAVSKIGNRSLETGWFTAGSKPEPQFWHCCGC